ncbi:MAG: ATPase, T2SS/T4P/T4SS family [Candidatus Omnitrophota bacterium]
MSPLKKADRVLYDALIESGSVTKESLEPALTEAQTSGQSLAQLIIRDNLAGERDILKILAGRLKLKFIDLKDVEIDKSVIAKVPVKVGTYYRFVPLAIENRTMTIAVAYPLDIKTTDEIRTQLGYDIEMVLSTSGSVTECLRKYYGFAADTLQEIRDQEADPGAIEARQPIHEKVEDIEKLVGDASVIRLVNQIILEGWRKRATDIHIAPFRGGVILRYRIDGILYDTNVPPEMKHFLSAIISRIKIMSNLNIVERRLPQDGRAVVKVQNQVLDLRISTMPTHFGESVVIRILPTQMLFSLAKLGLSKKDLQIFEDLVRKPHGIIFITGPTGSGKTTTLYACLSRINTKERKIITLEDPIEYEIDGITQIQVMQEIDFGFARGLRSVLRHDPDVIMVGEVRDLETAEIAVRVALTGHLVFSTLHTNDAASGFTRLVDIGVEPYLVASSVEVFIAQRLIRLLCPDCKDEDKDAPEELKRMIANDIGLKSQDKMKIFKAKGCPACNFTGFFGRSAMYEILLVDEEIKELVLKKAASSEIKKVALSKGMRTLRQDGWQKVIAGLTTPEEVMKVTPDEGHAKMEKARGAYYSEIPKRAETDSGSEKRIYRRLSKKVNVVYKVFGSDKNLESEGFAPEGFSVSKNISAGGLLFVANELLSIGSVLELKIELPDGKEPIASLAKVVRVEVLEEQKNYDTAICFLDITGAEKTRLSKFIEEESE